jgi:hypothetical protein
MRPLCDLPWSLLYRLQRSRRTLGFAVEVAIRVSIELPLQFLAIPFQHSFQAILCSKIRGIPLVGTVQLTRQIPVAIALWVSIVFAIRSVIVIPVNGLLPVPLQAV